MAAAITAGTMVNDNSDDEFISADPPQTQFHPLIIHDLVNKTSPMLAKDRRTVGDFLGLSKKMCSRNDAKISLKDILNFDISDLTYDSNEGKLSKACDKDPSLNKVEVLLKQGIFLNPATDDENTLISCANVNPNLILLCQNNERWDLVFFVMARAIQLEFFHHYFFCLHLGFGQLCFKNQVILGEFMINCVGIHLTALFWDYSLRGGIFESTRPNLTLFDTFLHCCALSGSPHMMSMILERDKSLIEVKNGYGNTALHVACLEGYVSCAGILLNNNADINVVNRKGQTPLHIAAQSASEEMLYLLLSKNIDVNCTDNHNRTPLFAAAYAGNSVAASILVKHEAVVDWRDHELATPLMSAIQGGHASTVEVLLTLGAVTDVKNNKTQSPTDIALEQMQDASLAVLIRKLKGSEDFNALPWYKIINNRMHKSIYSMLDCSIRSSPISNKDILDSSLESSMPRETVKASEKQELTGFQLIAESGDEDLAYHGVMRLYVDKEMKKIGDRYLIIKTFLHSLYLIALGFALNQAATEHISVTTLYCLNCRYDFYDVLRFVAELYVVLFWIWIVISEMGEFQLLLETEDRKNISLIKKIINWFASWFGKSLKIASDKDNIIDSSQPEQSKVENQNGMVGEDSKESPSGFSETNEELINLVPLPKRDAKIDTENEVESEILTRLEERKHNSKPFEYPDQWLKGKDLLVEFRDSPFITGEQGTEVVDVVSTSFKKKLKDIGWTCLRIIWTVCIFFPKFYFVVFKKWNNIAWTLVKYFSDFFNWLDTGGILFIFVIIFLRFLTIVAPHLPGLEYQWYVAPFAFLLSSFSIIKLLNIYSVFGTYIRIIILVCKRDVSKFLLLFIITLFLFVMTFLLSLRVPLPVVINGTNQTRFFINYFNTSQELSGIIENFGYLLIFGTRILLDEEVLGFPYVTTLNFLAVITYMVFVFIVIVLYLNIFIAQLTDTYGSVKKNAEKIVARYRMDFVHQIQKKSLLSFVAKRKPGGESIVVEKDDFKKYFLVEGIFEIDAGYSYGKGKDLHGLVDTYSKEQKLSLAEHQRTQVVLQHRIQAISDFNHNKMDKLSTQFENLEIRFSDVCNDIRTFSNLAKQQGQP